MRRRLVVLVCILALAVACSPKRAGGGGAPERVDTYVVVNNLQTELYTIYVTDGSRRVRVGTATPLRKTRMRVPPGMIFPAVQLQFLAQPQGNAPAPISELIAVSPGDEIGISIGP
ncbi:MAG TPA: hypothetical protein VFR95_11340 [Gemmatimonadaceae bacterium]|nr:hypothetical protein [Gemmatimonadaceae bacterium]